MNLRDDLQLIYDWIPEGSRVLDLGCGDGELLAALVEHKKCSGYGIESTPTAVIAAMSRGVNVFKPIWSRVWQNLATRRLTLSF